MVTFDWLNEELWQEIQRQIGSMLSSKNPEDADNGPGYDYSRLIPFKNGDIFDPNGQRRGQWSICNGNIMIGATFIDGPIEP